MRNYLNFNKKEKGFTLIELVITACIIGILSVVATTSYQKTMIKNKRTEAKNKLFEVMQRQEKYMSENNTYTLTLSNLGYASGDLLSSGGYYKLTAAASANGITDGVVITAAPQGSQVKDTDCASLILNSNGLKSSSTGSTSCW